MKQDNLVIAVMSTKTIGGQMEGGGGEGRSVLLASVTYKNACTNNRKKNVCIHCLSTVIQHLLVQQSHIRLV